MRRIGANRAAILAGTAGLALVGLFGLQVLTDHLGSRVPALRDFRNYLVHSEGS
jgi:hypothetical protein